MPPFPRWHRIFLRPQPCFLGFGLGFSEFIAVTIRFALLLGILTIRFVDQTTEQQVAFIDQFRFVLYIDRGAGDTGQNALLWHLAPLCADRATLVCLLAETAMSVMISLQHRTCSPIQRRPQ